MVVVKVRDWEDVYLVDFKEKGEPAPVPKLLSTMRSIEFAEWVHSGQRRYFLLLESYREVSDLSPAIGTRSCGTVDSRNRRPARRWT
jgi:hypothetical protein